MRTRPFHPLGVLALLTLAACSPSAPAATGSAEDEQAIRAVADKYSAAMNAKDTAAFGAILADDYQAVDPAGRHIQGREAAVRMAAEENAMMPPGMTMSLKATTTFVRWINANHATAGGTWEMSPAMPGMPSKGSWMAVVVKQDSVWKMQSALGAADVTPMMPDTTKK